MSSDDTIILTDSIAKKSEDREKCVVCLNEEGDDELAPIESGRDKALIKCQTCSTHCCLPCLIANHMHRMEHTPLHQPFFSNGLSTDTRIKPKCPTLDHAFLPESTHLHASKRFIYKPRSVLNLMHFSRIVTWLCAALIALYALVLRCSVNISPYTDPFSELSKSTTGWLTILSTLHATFGLLSFQSAVFFRTYEPMESTKFVDERITYRYFGTIFYYAYECFYHWARVEFVYSASFGVSCSPLIRYEPPLATSAPSAITVIGSSFVNLICILMNNLVYSILPVQFISFGWQLPMKSQIYSVHSGLGPILCQFFDTWGGWNLLLLFAVWMNSIIYPTLIARLLRLSREQTMNFSSQIYYLFIVKRIVLALLQTVFSQAFGNALTFLFYMGAELIRLKTALVEMRLAFWLTWYTIDQVYTHEFKDKTD